MPQTPDKPSAATAIPGVTIARLSAQHIDLVEPLWRSLLDHIRELGSVVPVVPHSESWPRYKAQCEELFGDGESFGLGAFRGSELIGYATVRIAPADPVWAMGRHYVELAALSVAPGERDQGVGTALFDAVERSPGGPRHRGARHRRGLGERARAPLLRAPRLHHRLPPDAHRLAASAGAASGPAAAADESPETAAHGEA